MSAIDLTRLKSAKSVFAAAQVCLEIGLTPVPVSQDGSGKPLVKWNSCVPSHENLRILFSKACNIAVIGGSRSSGLTDIDVDQDDTIDLAKIAFPGTVTFGRGSRRHSHFLLRCEGGTTEKFAAPAELKDDPLWQSAHKLMIIERQSESKLITIPPSIHRTRQPYRWDSENAIVPEFDAEDVRRRLAAVAVMTVFLRNYPGEGERNAGCLVISALLVRAGNDPELVDDLVRCAARAAGDEDWQRRGGADGALERLGLGLPLPGIPRLVEILGLEDFWKPWLGRALFPRKAERIIDPKNPLEVARAFMADAHTEDGSGLIQRYQGAYYRYDGARYAQLDRELIRASVYKYLETTDIQTKEGTRPCRPDAGLVTLVLDALPTICATLPPRPRPPVWLGGTVGRNPNNLVVLSDSMVDVDNDETLPLTPRLFNLNALPIAYDPAPPQPQNWNAFMASISVHDAAIPSLIEEVLGAVIGGETRFGKIFLLYGPTRAGKGVLLEEMQGILGTENYASPLLSRLGDPHALSDLIDKQAAFIQDARLGGRSDKAAVTEALLTISGGGHLTIPRKYLSGWTGELKLNFVLATNEIPRLNDDSGALAGRFVPIVLKASFFGREDFGLKERLRAERPAILLRALAGLKRLRERERFDLPPSSRAFMQELSRSMSEIGTFLEDCYEMVAGEHEAVDVVFADYHRWCGLQNIRHPSSKEQLGRRLHACGITRRVVRIGGDRRMSVYDGLRRIADAM